MATANLSSCPGTIGLPLVQRFLNGWLTTAVIGLGLLFNSLSIAVFHRKVLVDRRRSTDSSSGHEPPRNPFQNYLLALAVWDNLLLLGAFHLYSIGTVLYKSPPITGTYVYFYPVSYPLSHICQTATIWLTVVLLSWRYRLIRHPIHNRPSGSHKCSSLLGIALVSVLSLLWGVPIAFEIQVTSCRGGDNSSETLPIVGPSSLRWNSIYSIYRLLGSLLIQSGVPLLALITLLWCMLRELRRAHTIRHDLTGSHSSDQAAERERQTSGSNLGQLLNRRRRSTAAEIRRRAEKRDNLMLICVVLKFLLTRLLPVAIDVAQAIFDLQVLISDQLVVHLANVSNALVVLNSASNFWLYLLLGVRFREKFCQLFGCRGHCPESSESAFHAQVETTELHNASKDHRRAAEAAN